MLFYFPHFQIANILFFVAQRPTVPTAHTDTHTHTHTHTHTILRTSDELFAEVATYTTQTKHKRRASMGLAGFEVAITTIKRLHTYALELTAAGIGR